MAGLPNRAPQHHIARPGRRQRRGLPRHAAGMRRRADAKGVDGAGKVARIVDAADRRHHRGWSHDQAGAARAAQRPRQIWRIAALGADDLLDRFVCSATLAAHARRYRIERGRVVRRTVQALPYAAARRLSADLPGKLLLGRVFSPWDLVAYAVAIIAGALADRAIESSMWRLGPLTSRYEALFREIWLVADISANSEISVFVGCDPKHEAVARHECWR